MKSLSYLLISSCLSTLVIGQKDDLKFPYPGQNSYYDPETQQTYYFRYQGHKPSNIPHVCQDQQSVICIVKNGSLEVDNTGHFDSFTKEKTDTERFSYIFDNGQRCHKSGGDKKFKTRIDYFCPDEDADYTSPITLIKGGDPCLVNFFVWYQGENCQKHKSNSCILDLPAYDTRLDLSVLKEAKVYDVKNGTDQFQVNLCGGIEASEKCPKGVGLCNQDQVLVKAGFKMTTWFDYDSQQIKMEYTGQDQTKVLFTFECDINVDVKIEFDGQEGDKYRFLVKTKRVCLSKPQNCQFHDEVTGNFYDLSGLQRQMDEWIADDDNDKDRKYHLAVCKPISPASAESHCAGSQTAICAESSKTKDSIVIATVDDEFKLSGDQALILTYDQGSRCNAKYNYSAQVIFRCTEEPSNPIVMDILDNCTYIFEWKTSHACPQIADESKGCTVKDDFFGHTFDLSPLHQIQDRKVGDYSINICGGLQSSSCGSGASICYEDKLIGLSSSEKLHFSDGELFLEYHGTQCKDSGIKYTSNIMFVCDHEIGLGTPELGINDDCHFVFTWKTSYVCPPHEEIDCQVQDENGELFDFSELALSDYNYEIPMRNENEMIVLNTCKSLVHSSMSRCPYNSAVCLRQKVNETYVFTSLGQVDQSPQLDEYHRLVLEYPNGGICKEQGTKEPHISTKIIFNCRMDKKDSKPSFIEKVGCTYVFWWDHHSACPQNSSHLVTKDSCMVTDEESGHTYDMRPLKTDNLNGLLAFDLNKNTFHVGVCNSPKDMKEKCGSKSAACMVLGNGTYINIGDVNDRLTLQDGQPVLHYDHESYHTTVRFQCAPIRRLQNSRLVLLEKVKNHFYFDFFTPLACPFTVHCQALSSKNEFWSYDLSALKNYKDDVKVDNTYFSVCKPLSGMSSTCPPGSAICERFPDGFRSYGVAVDPPRVIKTSEVSINYEGGSLCREVDNIRYNSTISFICNPEVFPGKPKLDKIDHGGCHRKYIWNTMAACPNQTFPEEFDTSDCHLQRYQKFFTLESFRSQNDQVIKSGQNTYFVQPCGKSSHCKSPICLEKGGKVISMGKLASSQFLMDEQEMRIKYENGDPCVPYKDINMTYSSEIRFLCDDEDTLELLDDLPCHPIFRWKSSKVCSYFVKSPEQSKPTFHRVEKMTFILLILLISIIVVVFFVKNPQHRERVHEKIVWMRVWCLRQRNRQDDRNLLVNHNVTIPTFDIQEEDDDDLIIA